MNGYYVYLVGHEKPLFVQADDWFVSKPWVKFRHRNTLAAAFRIEVTSGIVKGAS